MSEQEVGKGSLWGDGQEVTFVLWVDLDPKAHYKKIKNAKDKDFLKFICTQRRTIMVHLYIPSLNKCAKNKWTDKIDIDCNGA